MNLSQYPLGTTFKHTITGQIFTVMRMLHHITLEPTYYLYCRETDISEFSPTEELYTLVNKEDQHERV